MGLGWQRKLPTWRFMKCYTTHDAYPSRLQHSTFLVFISIPLADLNISPTPQRRRDVYASRRLLGHGSTMNESFYVG